MINLMNPKFLIYGIITCIISLLGYILYCLIKKSYISTNIEIISNKKNVAYRNITKFSLTPLWEVNGDLSGYTIHEWKFEQINLLYGPEIAAFRVTPAEVWDTISSFEAAALQASDINETIITILSYIHP